MKLRPDQLSAHLKQLHLQQCAPVYIISGDEPLQVSECCDQIRLKARQQGFTERHVYHIDKTFDWGEVLEAANTLSLFAEKQIIELRMPGKPGDAGRKVFKEYIDHPSPDNLLLIITDRLDNATQKEKWFKALEHEGVFIPIWPIEAYKLPEWIAQRLKQDGFSATRDALSLIAERVEGNLLAASQELEKLKLLAKDQRINEETVQSAISDNARYDVFQLTDAALTGNVKLCVRILGVLKGEGIEPPVVLWALVREIRLLSYMSRLKSKGMSTDAVIEQSAKVMGFAPFILKKRRPILEKTIQRHSEKHFRDMLQMTGTIDRSIKGLDRNNPWDELLTLTLFLAGMPPVTAQI
ncbi:DNA polymerase III subunit delta [Endozoicomonas sp. (ex Bugula neritina AB1)]|nr:DNA polymerase III subunit delta [Endozoicomonas sp. (ex Bugula neritina AB1)]